LRGQRFGGPAAASTNEFETDRRNALRLLHPTRYIQLKQQYDTIASPAFGTNVRFTNNDSVITARWGLNYIFGASPY
jgi:hypothetical protein